MFDISYVEWDFGCQWLTHLHCDAFVMVASYNWSYSILPMLVLWHLSWLHHIIEALYCAHACIMSQLKWSHLCTFKCLTNFKILCVCMNAMNPWILSLFLSSLGMGSGEEFLISKWALATCYSCYCLWLTIIFINKLIEIVIIIIYMNYFCGHIVDVMYSRAWMMSQRPPTLVEQLNKYPPSGVV